MVAPVRDGISWPIGATLIEGGVNFSVYSKHSPELQERDTLRHVERDARPPAGGRRACARRGGGPGRTLAGPHEADRRAREISYPYHAEISDEIDRRRAAGRLCVLVFVHSFTLVFLGLPRPWHAGVLYNRDARLAEPLLQLLRGEGDLVVGCNQPYAASDLSDYSLVQHGERRDIPYVELEIRQDLIADEAGQAAWAERLACLLLKASGFLPELAATRRQQGRT